MTEALPFERCLEPANELLPGFCLGDLTEQERDEVLLHVLDCDVCWAEIRRLEATVTAIRHSPGLPPLPLTPAAISAIKLSAKREQAFSGHFRFALFASLLHGLLYTASLWTELAYGFDQFGTLVVALSPAVFVFVSAVTLSALSLAARQIRSGRSSALEVSAMAMLASVVVLCAGLAVVLPSETTIAATFSTRSAFDGYLKNAIMYFGPLGLVYLLLPWHIVLGLERELDQGRISNTLGLLTHSPSAFHPRGVWFIRPLVLGVLLLPAAWIGYQGVHRMLDALLPGPYANFFTRALHLRVGLWFAIATAGFFWYVRRLQDLKQQAILMQRLGG